jgi:hypothetical protein
MPLLTPYSTREDIITEMLELIEQNVACLGERCGCTPPTPCRRCRVMKYAALAAHPDKEESNG